MEINKQPQLSFQGVDIVNLNFNVIASRKPDLQVDIICTPTVFYPDNQPNDFRIIMDIELKAVDCFDLTLRAIGSFQLDHKITPEIKKVFINANAPAIMFPYVRAFVSTFTSNSGSYVGSLTIPTQFFKGDLEEYKN